MQFSTPKNLQIRYSDLTIGAVSFQKSVAIWRSILPVLRSRIIFIRLRVKILMRLRVLPYCIARQNIWNELKFKHTMKLSCSYDSVRFILLKIWTEWVINAYILCNFSIPNHVYYHCRKRCRRSRSRIPLRLRLWLQLNDAAPFGTGSTTLDFTN
jgi:hypothetical protein